MAGAYAVGLSALKGGSGFSRKKFLEVLALMIARFGWDTVRGV